jgi:hypothetical protein
LARRPTDAHLATCVSDAREKVCASVVDGPEIRPPWSSGDRLQDFIDHAARQIKVKHGVGRAPGNGWRHARIVDHAADVVDDAPEIGVGAGP